MSLGEKVKLIVPPTHAFGKEGIPTLIPPDS